MSTKFYSIFVSISVLLIINWALMIYFGLWPYAGFDRIAKEVWPEDVVNITGKCYIAVSALVRDDISWD
ncbi:hypothetical protein Q1695_012393 [Nippostrongylus brasiliensis]|nr:hypothetical protein Q1695_012393 [Nippostrongylus brasiliensis]